MTENTASQSPATVEEVTAAFDEVRQAQAAQRVMVAQAAWDMFRDESCSLCASGVNNWLRDHGIPEIPDLYEDEDAILDGDALRTAALRLVPELQHVDWYTPLGLQRQVTERREEGERWLEGLIRDLRQVQRQYAGDIAARRTEALTRQLRGEPEPETTEAESTPAPAAGSPAAGMTHIAMNVALTLQVPTARINGATHQQIIAAAESTIGNAIHTAVANSQYGARFADGTEIRTAVQHG